MTIDYTPIPANLRDIYEELESQLSWLHEEWKMYRQLFGTNAERIELMNEMCPTFTYNLQFMTHDWITLSICRLAVDNSRVARKDTLVVALLHEQLDRVRYPALGAALDAAFVDVKRTCGILQKHRHTRIAHLNRAAHLTSKTHQLPSRQQIEDALEAVRRYMNIFREEFMGSPLYFEGVMMLDDAKTMLWCLLQAQEYGKLERENPGEYHTRLRANNYYSALQNDATTL
ncbi:MAG: hypothetical protein K1X67_21060 [Fimbriimonadaceae bacterium]|nr:hypothetical protein [Fimbriimonadaceae bacterium]